MSPTSLSVWFVCRLCRGSFGQVDAFIEHKKQKHFTQFQNTTSIVFEESEQGEQYLVVINAENQPVDESNQPPIKVEITDDDIINSLGLEIIDEPNLDLVEPKNELITYESELNPENENNFFGLKQPQQNPYVLLKRLTPEEIESACVPQHHSTLLKCEQENLVNSLEPCNAFDADNIIIDYSEIKKSSEIQSTATISNTSAEGDLQFVCKLCSKQLQSEAQLKIHVGICALYHKDRNRFCVICNRKLSRSAYLKGHHLRFHGTEEEKLSLFKFKCHVCAKQYRHAMDFRFHLESHKEKKQKVETSNSNPRCSHPNCGKEFRFNFDLQRHIATVHLGVRPFSCSFRNCNKAFKQREHLNTHFRTHTGERPYKCPVGSCNKVFSTSGKRLRHERLVHSHV